MNRFFWSCINVLSRGKSIFLCINIKAQAPGSQLWCRAVMSLQFTYVPSFACRGRLRKLRRGCSTVVLYCVTMNWQQICKGSFRVPVAGVLLACDCWTQASYQAMQRDSDGGKPRAYILCEKKHEWICSNIFTSLKNPFSVRCDKWLIWRFEPGGKS